MSGSLRRCHPAVSRLARGPRTGKPATCRPTLEALEDRQLLVGNLTGTAYFGPGNPAVCSWPGHPAPGGDSRLDVFWRDQDNHLRHRWWDGTGWASTLGDPARGPTPPPAAPPMGFNRIDVFYRGQDYALRHTWWDGPGRGSGWQPADEAIGGTQGLVQSAPAVCSWSGTYGRLDVFYKSGAGLGHVFW